VTRRDLIAILGTTAVSWPLGVSAQQPERMRRIGVLMGTAGDDPVGKARVAAFLQGLQQLGWTEGNNVRIDYRWATADTDRFRRYAAELIELAPEVILASSAPSVASLLQATRTVPIVFAAVTDPVGAGYVDSLARPGGNATGFMSVEFGLSAKFLELLKQIAPAVTRVAVLRNPASGIGQLGALQAAAPSFGVELTPIGDRNAEEIERGITVFARGATDGLITTSAGQTQALRDLIIALAARHRLPAVYPFRRFVADGGLISFGTDQAESYRRAAGYVDRILRGEKPSDLPVQAPVKYELAINRKTAKVLGLVIPPSMLAIADEVIE
jgi:putative ABC transport system substrate-binding protein